MSTLVERIQAKIRSEILVREKDILDNIQESDMMLRTRGERRGLQLALAAISEAIKERNVEEDDD